MNIKTKKSQLGWTTMEYIVGALLIITIVTGVIGTIESGLNAKAQKIQDSLSK